MREVSYNFDLGDIVDGNYEALYEQRRRDALFAFAFSETGGSLVLGRDHLGNVPLFYRAGDGKADAALWLPELMKGDETIDEAGLRSFIATGTIKTIPIFNEIKIVPPGTVLRVFPDGKTEMLYEYTIRPRDCSRWSFSKCVAEADRLLLQAAKRTLKEKTVGLYLSGGIDSALSGLYLKKAGAKVRAYTATPWGQESAEARLAKDNAQAIGVAEHTIRPLLTSAYSAYADESLRRYGNPCGATSQMAILCLLTETAAASERQIYFAQNCDTMNASVPDQSLLFFLSFLPSLVRGMLRKTLGAPSIIEELASFRTVGLIRSVPFLHKYEKERSILAKLSIAGMYFAHTPVDGDIVILPSMKKRQIASNLFYDMEVVEFALGIPLRHRLSFAKESKLGIAIGKRVFRALARRALSEEIVQRKKGLTVPEGRDESSRVFFETLPKHAGPLTLSLPNQRFAAGMLSRFAKETGSKALRTLFTASHD